MGNFYNRKAEDNYIKRDDIVACWDCKALIFKESSNRVDWDDLCQRCFDDRYVPRKGK